jgi:hypothetical protein
MGRRVTGSGPRIFMWMRRALRCTRPVSSGFWPLPAALAFLTGVPASMPTTRRMSEAGVTRTTSQSPTPSARITGPTRIEGTQERFTTLVEHPAGMARAIQVATTEFSPSYRRAAVMQASLAIAGIVFSVIR